MRVSSSALIQVQKMKKLRLDSMQVSSLSFDASSEFYYNTSLEDEEVEARWVKNSSEFHFDTSSKFHFVGSEIGEEHGWVFNS